MTTTFVAISKPLFPEGTAEILKAGEAEDLTVSTKIVIRPVLDGCLLPIGDLPCGIEARWCEGHNHFEARIHIEGPAPLPDLLRYEMASLPGQSLDQFLSGALAEIFGQLCRILGVQPNACNEQPPQVDHRPKPKHSVN
jgi:hypothetical protein